MNYNEGYSAKFYVSVVDPRTWNDLSRFEITGGSINRSDGGLRHSADIECVNYTDTSEQWIRIWMDVRQGGTSDHVALFTGLTSTPSRTINGTRVSTQKQCYSVLKPAEDVLLPRGWYAPIDINSELIIRNLLSVTGVNVIPSGEMPILTEAIIAEDGESNLTMIDKILLAVDWRMTIDGYGSIYLSPYPTEETALFDSMANDIIEPELNVNYDWFSCPNVFRAISGNISATVRDEDPDSPLSTVSRGREIWAEETNCDMYEGETIGDYAFRRLNELQQVAMTISYSRRFNPAVNVTDLVRLNYPAQNLVGLFEVTSQSIELGYGARVSEEVVQA